MTSGKASAAVVAQRTVEDQEHRRGCAPDVAFAIGDRPEIAADRAEHPEMALLVCRIEQKRQRNLENGGDLDRIRFQHERRLDPSDHRRHAKAGHGFVFGQLPQQGDLRRRQSDFLGRLAQRGRRSAMRRRVRRGRRGS